MNGLGECSLKRNMFLRITRFVVCISTPFLFISKDIVWIGHASFIHGW